MKVREYYGLEETDGEVGIEIEVEGQGVADIRPPRWNVTRDGSLRGESAEYVLRAPCNRDEVHSRVGLVQKALKSAKAQVVDTGRAGVHVHINVQEMTFTEVMNFITSYLIFEDLLTEFCGEHRVGNLFCLRVRDADDLIETLRAAVKDRCFRKIRNGSIRYAAVNFESLRKFGSLEFRAMRSTVDPDEIDQWVKLLLSVRDWSVGFKDPQEIVMEFSRTGPDRVFHEVFGDYSALLMYDEGLLFEGVRNAQYLAFATDNWDFCPYADFMRIVDQVGPDFVHYELMQDYKIRERFFRDIGTGQALTELMQKYVDKRGTEAEGRPHDLHGGNVVGGIAAVDAILQMINQNPFEDDEEEVDADFEEGDDE